MGPTAWGPHPRPLLIVNADDFGLTAGTSEAILRAHRDGIVTSTSALAVGRTFDAAADALVSSGIGVGAHLALIGEDPPLLTTSEIPTLVGRSGFRRSWREFTRALLAGRIDLVDVRKELQTQLEHLLDRGVHPTHLDSHQHIHLLPPIGEVVLDLACSHGVRAVRTPRGVGASPRSSAVRVLGSRLAARARRRGIATTDRFVGLEHSGHMTIEPLSRVVGGLDAMRVSSVEVSVHPGLPVDAERDRFDWGFEWGAELDALCSARAKGAAAAAGFDLGTFADLPAHRRAL